VIYYANPCTEGVRDAMLRGQLGCITTPAQGNVTFPDEWDCVADNGCFRLPGQKPWEERPWLDWLRSQPRRFRFAVCPDVVDLEGKPTHDETIDRWAHYGGMMARHGFVPAFVAQIGCTPDSLPDDASVIFLGGTTEWKLGPVAWSIVARAKAEGRWVHMGRVNSKRRFDTARAMRCDSVDGTYLTFGPDTNLPKLLSWLGAADDKPMLWEATA
jgi:hypothetical protein